MNGYTYTRTTAQYGDLCKEIAIFFHPLLPLSFILINVANPHAQAAAGDERDEDVTQGLRGNHCTSLACCRVII